MSDKYKIRIDAKSVGPSMVEVMKRDPDAQIVLSGLLNRLNADLASVLADDNVTRIPESEILEKEGDTNLAFFAYNNGRIEVGFYIDIEEKIVTITSIKVDEPARPVTAASGKRR